MLFWILVAILTALAALFLLWPIMRGSGRAERGRLRESAIYRDQMTEIDRDLEQGLIAPDEAANARAEIGRRLLASDDGRAEETEGLGSTGARPLFRMSELAVVLFLPLIALSLYLYAGTPGLPDQPLEARLANPGNNIELLVVKVERHLAQNPDDGRGWETLAPIYQRMQRFADAERADRAAIRLLGPTPERLGRLAETLMGAAQGSVTADARILLNEVLKQDPTDARAAYYLALGLEQDGKRAEAKAAFEALAKASAPDAPWQGVVGEHIAALNGTKPAANPKAPGNPTAADVEAMQGMDAGDRQQMILTMVEGLDQKLKDDPDNFEGWMRLIRSLGVLGETGRADDALKRAIAAFPADGEQGRQILALAREIGLSTDGVK